MGDGRRRRKPMKRGRLDSEVRLALLGTQTVGAPRRLTEAKPLLVVQSSNFLHGFYPSS